MENKTEKTTESKKTINTKKAYESPSFTKHEPLDSVSQLVYYYYWY